MLDAVLGWVTKIHITSTGAGGPIPPELCNFPSLRELVRLALRLSWTCPLFPCLLPLKLIHLLLAVLLPTSGLRYEPVRGLEGNFGR